MCVLSRSVVYDSLQPHGLQPTRLLCPRNFPGKNTGVGCHAFLQGIFLTQGSNPHLLLLLHWQADSLPLSHLVSSTWPLKSFNSTSWIKSWTKHIDTIYTKMGFLQRKLHLREVSWSMFMHEISSPFRKWRKILLYFLFYFILIQFQAVPIKIRNIKYESLNMKKVNKDKNTHIRPLETNSNLKGFMSGLLLKLMQNAGPFYEERI